MRNKIILKMTASCDSGSFGPVFRYRVAYKKETGECKLEISMTFADDAGEYSIFVKNPHGEVSASASLLEEGTGAVLPPSSCHRPWL